MPDSRLSYDWGFMGLDFALWGVGISGGVGAVLALILAIYLVFPFNASDPLPDIVFGLLIYGLLSLLLGAIVGAVIGVAAGFANLLVVGAVIWWTRSLDLNTQGLIVGTVAVAFNTLGLCGAVAYEYGSVDTAFGAMIAVETVAATTAALWIAEKEKRLRNFSVPRV